MAFEPPSFLNGTQGSSTVPAQGTTPAPDVFASSAPAQDPYALSETQLLELLKKTIGFCEPGRELYEYQWWRALLYLLERQWIYWNPTSRQFQDKRLAKWIPKPVTNIVRTTLLSVRATTQAIQLGVTAVPNGRAPKNLVAAKTADDLEPVIADEHDMQSVFMEADFTAGLFGNAFLHTYWDKNDFTHAQTVTMWLCPVCATRTPSDALTANKGRCPNCNSPGPFSQAGTQSMPMGKGCTICLTPLEVLMPLYAQSFSGVDRLVHREWKPRHQIEEAYDPAITNRVTWDKGPQARALQLYKAIATTSDLSLTPSVWNSGTFAGEVEGATIQHLWFRPSKTYPEGLYACFIGESNPVYAPGEYDDQERPVIPTTRRDGSPLWPFVNYPYEPIKGRLYAQSAVDPVIKKNDQINQMDSLSIMAAQRMGNPIWLEPKGAEVERFTGEPGLVVKYTSLGPNSAKPERIGGENPSAVIPTLREQAKQDAEELAGTYDVLKGAKPAGVEAFSALQLLVERSQSRFQTLFKNRAAAYTAWYSIAIELERKYGPAERVQAVLGPNRAWTFNTFLQANLDGDISIRTEDGSLMPKTALAKRANLDHANQLGMINRMDPEQQYQVLQSLGLPELVPSLDADMAECGREQDAFEQWANAGFQGPCPLIRLPWHNDRVHLQENRKWMNSDAVRMILQKAGPNVAQIVGLLAQHLQEHEQAIMAAQMAMAGGPPGAGAQPGQPPPPGQSSNAPRPPTGAQTAESNAHGPAQPGGTAPGVGAGRAMANSREQSQPPHGLM